MFLTFPPGNFFVPAHRSVQVPCPSYTLLSTSAGPSIREGLQLCDFERAKSQMYSRQSTLPETSLFFSKVVHKSPRSELKFTGARNLSQVTAAPRQADFESTTPRPLPSKLKVLSLVAECVEINADLAKFEEFAGRSAMVGFAVATCAELALPTSGIFGTWGGNQANAYMGAAVLLVATAAGLAAMSKRKIGAQLHEAVLTSLTALSRSASSITNRNVDSAVDYVFEQVLGSSFVDRNLLEIDDFI